MTNLAINMVERNGRACLPFIVPQKNAIKTNKGIALHNWFTALFVRIFGSGIETIKNLDGTSFYYNRGSLVAWIETTKKFIPSKYGDDYISLNLDSSVDTIQREFNKVGL